MPLGAQRSGQLTQPKKAHHGIVANAIVRERYRTSPTPCAFEAGQ